MMVLELTQSTEGAGDREPAAGARAAGGRRQRTQSLRQREQAPDGMRGPLFRDLADTHYPKAELIRVVLDNLSRPTPRAPSMKLPRTGGAPHPATPGIPPHARARQLGERGGH